MQAMNDSVRNAVFAPAFFGTPLVCALAAFAAFQAGHKGATRAFAAAFDLRSMGIDYLKRYACALLPFLSDITLYRRHRAAML